MSVFGGIVFVVVFKYFTMNFDFLPFCTPFKGVILDLFQICDLFSGMFLFVCALEGLNCSSFSAVSGKQT